MLRSDAETRLNDLLAALALSAHRYHAAAEWLDGDASGLANAIGRDRRILAERLAEAIRLRGRLPDALDPERVEVGDLALRARAWWLGREHLLHETLTREDEKLAALNSDVARSIPDLRELTEAIAIHLRHAGEQLASVHVRD